MIITDLMKTTKVEKEKKNPNNGEAIKIIIRSLYNDDFIDTRTYEDAMNVVEGVTR